jgi:uncharacterized cysteine cluster protein YcgN (CxxCxxCC family)
MTVCMFIEILITGSHDCVHVSRNTNNWFSWLCMFIEILITGSNDCVHVYYQLITGSHDCARLLPIALSSPLKKNQWQDISVLPEKHPHPWYK